MITWMQRHKKWLIITIWISTIAFVGAGFVGWGQYNYGDKAGAVAKVGDVEITQGQLQKTYSNLYNQYSQIFQGNFDEEKAKSFGLESQALRQLTQQALVLNLANSYGLEISDKELLTEIKNQKYFFDNDVFSKEVYKQVLSRNKLSIKEYENDVRKELLIKKTLQLLPIEANKNELNIIEEIGNIADTINYKILTSKDITIDTSDEKIKAFWQTMQTNFMNDISYDVKFIKQEKISLSFDDAKISEYYNDNKTHFKDTDGKILGLDKAKQNVITELNAKETKKEALRSYIAYKKGKLDTKKIQTTNVSLSNNQFNDDVLVKLSKLTMAAPFLKPILINENYFTFELIKINKATPKTYEEAKDEVLPMYFDEQKRVKLQELAKKLVATFNGQTLKLVTIKDTEKLTLLKANQANEFLIALFSSQDKRGFITLADGSIVLYNILEQKMLTTTNNNVNNPIVKLKSTMFNEGLIKKLQNKYKTEIFIQGL